MLNKKFIQQRRDYIPLNTEVTFNTDFKKLPLSNSTTETISLLYGSIKGVF